MADTGIPILLVDDDRFMRTVLCQTLQDAGYQVSQAANGKEALELCRTSYFPIILTDWVMPEMDGIAFCRAFREKAAECYTYLILLTSQEGKDKLIEGLEAGADEYLLKPVNEAELMVRLKTARRILDLESSLQKSLEEIKQLSIRDPLTGMFNRGYLDQNLPHEIRRAERYLRDFSLIMMDLDHFKKINDTWGHQAGDAVLQHCTRIIAGTIRREVDWVARYGGEEFVLVLPETDQAGCSVVAERLRNLIALSTCSFRGENLSITASFGTVTRSPSDSTNDIHADFMLHKADQCLYQAKESGRNRIVRSSV
ncbi:MAG: diguanylate cyclase [Trichlorobacter sp.]|uniref:diguanylate cyclase n=1 Tax=Trichlorobacter sp. TaxID=2911007 RepID=UPI00256CFCF5|nr:diguanylate cyclase [Trichlorobacter sp.]MDK9717742.1 diguanylate cyclase [Trichlorobacter sp.]